MTSSDIRTAGERASPAVRRARGVKRRGGSALARGQRRIVLPFLSVALVLYTGLYILPSLYSVYTSFTNWDGINEPRWAGVSNFTRLANDPVFLGAFKNTLLVMLGVGITLFVLSFAFLLVLREMRAGKFLRGVIFVPHIISSVALAIFWGFLFRYEGLLNSALNLVNIPSVTWLGPNTAFYFIMAALVWISTGYYVTILMAGVDAIPGYYYEAALLDGASAWQRFRHVTIPLSWDTIGVAAVLWTITSVKIFEFIIAFGQQQGDLPSSTSWNTALFVYGMTIGGNNPAYRFGYASAAALVTLLLVLVLVVILRRVMRRESVQL